LEKQWNRKFS